MVTSCNTCKWTEDVSICFVLLHVPKIVLYYFIRVGSLAVT